MELNLNEFYPIGTVCKIRGYSELVMIIGYQKEKSGEIVNSYDYEGCFYPYGSLTKVKILFNQKEIVEVVFEGYKLTENKIDKQVAKPNFYNIENSDEKLYMDEDIYFVKNGVYNQLLFDKQGQVLIAEENS